MIVISIFAFLLIAFVTTMCVDFDMVVQEPFPWIVGGIVLVAGLIFSVIHYVQEKRAK